MHCIEKAERCKFYLKRSYDLTILSLNNRSVKSSEDFQSEHELSGNALIDSYACQLQSLSSFNEFRISKRQRFELELLQMMRNSKTKKNVNIETSCREAKMTNCVCLSQYICAWGSDEKSCFYDYESHVSSIWARNSQLLPVLTVAQQRDEIIAQRFQ